MCAPPLCDTKQLLKVTSKFWGMRISLKRDYTRTENITCELNNHVLHVVLLGSDWWAHVQYYCLIWAIHVIKPLATVSLDVVVAWYNENTAIFATIKLFKEGFLTNFLYHMNILIKWRSQNLNVVITLLPPLKQDLTPIQIIKSTIPRRSKREIERRVRNWGMCCS